MKNPNCDKPDCPDDPLCFETECLYRQSGRDARKEEREQMDKVPIETKVTVAVGIAVTFAAGIAIGLQIASALIGGWLR